MKIVITRDDKTKVTYDKVTDYSLSFRYLVPTEVKEKDNVFYAQIPVVKSDSASTGNLRDILKEVRELERELEGYILYAVPEQKT